MIIKAFGHLSSIFYETSSFSAYDTFSVGIDIKMELNSLRCS